MIFYLVVLALLFMIYIRHTRNKRIEYFTDNLLGPSIINTDDKIPLFGYGVPLGHEMTNTGGPQEPIMTPRDKWAGGWNNDVPEYKITKGYKLPYGESKPSMFYFDNHSTSPYCVSQYTSDRGIVCMDQKPTIYRRRNCAITPSS